MKRYDPSHCHCQSADSTGPVDRLLAEISHCSTEPPLRPTKTTYFSQKEESRRGGVASMGGGTSAGTKVVVKEGKLSSEEEEEEEVGVVSRKAATVVQGNRGDSSRPHVQRMSRGGREVEKEGVKSGVSQEQPLRLEHHPPRSVSAKCDHTPMSKDCHTHLTPPPMCDHTLPPG